MTIQEATNIISSRLGLTNKEALRLIEKAISGGETNISQIEEWINDRLMPNVVFLNEEEYAKMCIDALKILSRTAATDYGGSRQRDLGQLWADMTRGYLGELAFSKYLKSKWGIISSLGHNIGELSDYLPMDIHSIEKEGEKPRHPNVKIGIKTTKINGIWLDIPGDQFNHSDVHILVKVATGRDHLFAFFKKLSVFKDKILKKGEDVGSLTPEESSDLYSKLPNFAAIPAYICGFVRKDAKYNNLSYQGRLGRKNYKIFAWNGPIQAGDLDKIRHQNNVKGSINFEGIGKFAHDEGYLFNSGILLWKEKDWLQFIEKM